MSDRMRWRYGDTNPVQGCPAPGVSFDIGDLVFYNDGQLFPASSFGLDCSCVVRRITSYHENLLMDCMPLFLGVAMQNNRVHMHSGGLRVATSGVFEFDLCEKTKTQSLYLGDLLVPACVRDDDHCSLESQRVSKHFKHGVGLVAREWLTDNISGVLIDICSAIMNKGRAFGRHISV